MSTCPSPHHMSPPAIQELISWQNRAGTYEYMAPEALYAANEYEEDTEQMQEDLMQIFRANVASGAVVVVDQDVAVHGWPGESPEIQSRRSLARSGSIDRYDVQN